MSRTRKTVGILFSVIGVLLLFHPTLLPLVAYPLIHVDAPDNDATNLIFLRSAKISDDAFSFAKEFANRDPKHRVFVFHDFVRRAEAIGAAPSFLNITTQMLVDAGAMLQLDQGELADELSGLLRDPGRCLRMGAAGQRVVKNNAGALERLQILVAEELAAG